MIKHLTALVLGFGSTAVAADLKSTPWISDCDAPYCLFQRTLEFDDGSAFAVFEVLINIETGNASLVTTAPLGVAIEPGVKLSTGNATWQMDVKVCHSDGCRATAELNSTEFGDLLQQSQLDIRYVPFGGDQPVSASLPIDQLITAISQAQP